VKLQTHTRSLRPTPRARHVAGFWQPSADFRKNRGEISGLMLGDPDSLLKTDVVASNLGDFLEVLDFFRLLNLQKLIFVGRLRTKKCKSEG